MSQLSEIQRFISLTPSQQDAEIFESISYINNELGGEGIPLTKRKIERFNREMRLAYTWLALDRIASVIGDFGGFDQSLNTTDSVVFTGVEITDDALGLILSSPDNTRWRIQIDNTGTLSATSL